MDVSAKMGEKNEIELILVERKNRIIILNREGNVNELLILLS